MRGKAIAARTPGSFTRRLLLLVTLLTFAFQDLALQTHVHHATPAPIHQVQVQNLPASTPFKLLDSGEASCRLCQGFAQAGLFLTPATIDIAALLASACIAQVQTRGTATTAACHVNWQSRAPPRA